LKFETSQDFQAVQRVAAHAASGGHHAAHAFLWYLPVPWYQQVIDTIHPERTNGIFIISCGK
jgi:hypothetical protein